MTDTDWLTQNWPWWLAFGFLVVYEVYALVTKKGRTLSRMVWTSAKNYPWMVPIVFTFLAWLVLHFFVTHGDWAIELTWTGVLAAGIWYVYFLMRKRVTNGELH